MIKFISAYAAIAMVMTALDALWLAVIAKRLYRDGIGHLMAAKPQLEFAALFYLIFPVGIMLFAVTPAGASAEWNRTLCMAALFGFFAYVTYDLTNLAILKNWPLGLSVIDVAWGTLVTTVSAAAGKYVFDLFAN